MAATKFKLPLDGIILALVFVLANLRALIFFSLYPDSTTLLGAAWLEIGLWLLATFGILYFMRRENLLAKYLLMLQKNRLIFLFVLLALISTAWSLEFSVTLFRAAELLFATLMAAYLGMRYRSEGMMNMLFWFGAILLILSIALIFGAPRTGTMVWAPFDGAWRGIYWHRNHLSSITALVNAILLCRMMIAVENRQSTGWLDGFFYLLSAVVLYFAKSATGYILFVILNFFAVCAWVWTRVSHRLRKRHYYLVFGVAMVGSVVLLSNLDAIFGLFNRSADMTGRVFLWNFLLKEVVSQRLWWGHGFGAAWNLDPFRENARLHVGWTSQPLIADNGYLEILIHLGIAGLLIFLGILITAALRSIRYAFSHRTVAGFFPLLLLLYALFANIPFSLFAETEVFVWLLIVAVLFMTTPSQRIGSSGEPSNPVFVR